MKSCRVQGVSPGGGRGGAPRRKFLRFCSKNDPIQHRNPHTYVHPGPRSSHAARSSTHARRSRALALVYRTRSSTRAVARSRLPHTLVYSRSRTLSSIAHARLLNYSRSRTLSCRNSNMCEQKHPVFGKTARSALGERLSEARARSAPYGDAYQRTKRPFCLKNCAPTSAHALSRQAQHCTSSHVAALNYQDSDDPAKMTYSRIDLLERDPSFTQRKQIL